MKIVLVNTNLMRPPVVPVGLDYAATALKKKGHSVDLLDLCRAQNWQEECDSYFSKNSPDAIGATVRNSDDCYMASRDFKMPQIKKIINYIKLKSRAPIILGGAGFSVMPEQVLEFLDVNMGIWGEAEQALPLLLHVIKRPSEYAKVPGLVRKISSTYRRNPPAFADIYRFSLSARDTVDNLWYFQHGGMGAVETKRGCDKSCIFCADPVVRGKKCRLRNPEDVADEFENLLKQGVTHFHLCDSEFNLPYGHAAMVCHELIKRKLGEKIKWYTYAYPVPFDKSLAGLMKKAGCAGINFGADSADARMLRWLGKDYSPQDLGKTARACRDNGIPFMFDLLIGGMGETRKSIKRTITLMKETGPDCVGISLGIRVYPGTRLAEIAKSGLLSDKLHGKTRNNSGLLEPVFYLENDFWAYILELVEGDQRFFFPNRDKKSYNYNANAFLEDAIKKGERGAFWDILRRNRRPPRPREIELEQ